MKHCEVQNQRGRENDTSEWDYQEQDVLLIMMKAQDENLQQC